MSDATREDGRERERRSKLTFRGSEGRKSVEFC